MIGTATGGGCDDQNIQCDTAVDGDSLCVDLAGLVTEGYIGSVPISPDGNGTWTASYTGYTLTLTTGNNVEVRACESENTTEIFIAH